MRNPHIEYYLHYHLDIFCGWCYNTCGNYFNKKWSEKMQTTAENDILEGFGDSKFRAIVQKAMPLRSLAKSDFTLVELKILDIYLARINSHDPSRRTVRLKKGEVEELLGVQRIRKETLQKRLDRLFTPIKVELECPEGYEDAFRRLVLFEYIDFYKRDGQWEIELTCTERAMVGIFNIENLGYLKYKLMNIVNLKSRYSYVLYLFLENSLRSEVRVPIDRLKEELGCKGKCYDDYRLFNEKVLKPAVAEINEKTTLNCDYFTARDKETNKISGIIFEVHNTYAVSEKAASVNNNSPEGVFDNVPDEYLTDEQLQIKYKGKAVNIVGSGNNREVRIWRNEYKNAVK